MSLTMNYRALRKGMLFMCLMNPVFGANNPKQGDTTSLEFFEYLGTLMETNEGLFGPDLYIEDGMSDSTDIKLERTPPEVQTTTTVSEQNRDDRSKGGGQ